MRRNFFTNGQQAFAGGDCRGHESTAPSWVNPLTEREVLARVANHTVEASDYKMYFGQDGTLLYYTNFEVFPGNWYSCGVVVVFDWFNDEHDADRFLAIPQEGQLSFYNLSGRHLWTSALRQGKTF